VSASSAPLPSSSKPSPSPVVAKKKRLTVVIAVVSLSLMIGAVAYFLLHEETASVSEIANQPASVPLAPPPIEPVSPLPPIEPLPSLPLPPEPTPEPVDSVQLAPVPVPMSPAFRAWIDNVRITGVVSGSSPRAIINGRLVRPGDVVDASTGIVFEGVDIEQKQLIFRDRSGSIGNRSY
jgi:hypothetical protein